MADGGGALIGCLCEYVLYESMSSCQARGLRKKMSADSVCPFLSIASSLRLMPPSKRHFDIVQFPRSCTVHHIGTCCVRACLCAHVVAPYGADAENEKKQIENRNSHPNICWTRRCTGGWYNVEVGTRQPEHLTHSEIIRGVVQIRWVIEVASMLIRRRSIWFINSFQRFRVVTPTNDC